MLFSSRSLDASHDLVDLIRRQPAERPYLLVDGLEELLFGSVEPFVVLPIVGPTTVGVRAPSSFRD